MKIKRGYEGGLYAVFRDEAEAWAYRILFGTILRRRMDCFGGYMNAWKII